MSDPREVLRRVWKSLGLPILLAIVAVFISVSILLFAVATTRGQNEIIRTSEAQNIELTCRAVSQVRLDLATTDLQIAVAQLKVADGAVDAALVNAVVDRNVDRDLLFGLTAQLTAADTAVAEAVTRTQAAAVERRTAIQNCAEQAGT